MDDDVRTADDASRSAVGPSEGATAVQPRIERQLFHGPQGMRDLPIEGRFESRDADDFEAEVVRVQLGKLLLRRTTMSPHRAIVDGRELGVESDVLRFMTVKQGVLHAAPPGGAPVRLGVGDALFTCRPRTYAYQANEPLVMVVSVVPITSLPSIVQRLEDLPIGPLPHSPLVDAVVELLVNLADRLDEPWNFDADYAARGLIDLETAILTEIIAPRTPVPGPDRVYAAAVDYIDRHLCESELRPPQIAEAIGVSVRYLHRAFDDKEVTVARLLRERRLDRVAHVLRTAERAPSLQNLAVRFGFGNQDQLARAFRRHYGSSMSDYRADHPS